MIRPLLVAALLLVATPALAQQTPPAEELLALNLYVQQGDEAASQAELRRLQLKYPQWTPPTNLGKLTGTVPQDAIATFYRQVAAGQVDAAKATLAEARTDYPDWTPPADMTEQLATAEGQAALDDALKGGDVEAARSVAARTPGLMRCERINNAWQLADGQRAAGDKAAALATYRAILGACVNPADLSATLEKADGVSSEAELRAMAAQVNSRFPAEAGRFDPLLKRLLAGRGVATAAATAEAASPAPAGTAPASQPEEAVAQPKKQVKAPAKPGRTHRTATSTGAATKTEPRATRVSPNESPAQCAARLAGARSGGPLLERAWCVYNLDRTMDASADFRGALRGRLDAQQRRDAQYGLSLTYLKMGMAEEASRIAAQADFDRRQRVDVERQILDQRGVMAYKQHRYRDAIRYFDAIEQVTGSIRRDLAVLRAYAYLNAGQRTKSLSEFRRLNDQLSTEETRRGLKALLDN